MYQPVQNQQDDASRSRPSAVPHAMEALASRRLEHRDTTQPRVWSGTLVMIAMGMLYFLEGEMDVSLRFYKDFERSVSGVLIAAGFVSSGLTSFLGRLLVDRYSPSSVWILNGTSILLIWLASISLSRVRSLLVCRLLWGISFGVARHLAVSVCVARWNHAGESLSRWYSFWIACFTVGYIEDLLSPIVLVTVATLGICVAIFVGGIGVSHFSLMLRGPESRLKCGWGVSDLVILCVMLSMVAPQSFLEIQQNIHNNVFNVDGETPILITTCVGMILLVAIFHKGLSRQLIVIVPGVGATLVACAVAFSVMMISIPSPKADAEENDALLAGKSFVQYVGIVCSTAAYASVSVCLAIAVLTEFHVLGVSIAAFYFLVDTGVAVSMIGQSSLSTFGVNPIWPLTAFPVVWIFCSILVCVVFFCVPKAASLPRQNVEMAEVVDTNEGRPRHGSLFDDDDNEVEQGSSVLDKIQEYGDISSFAELITRTGLHSDLGDKSRMFTVLAPCNAAMESGLALAARDGSTESSVASYHIIEGECLSVDGLKRDPRTELPSKSGAMIWVALDVYGGVLVNESVTIMKTLRVVDNGVVHVMDSVLRPLSRRSTVGTQHGISASLPARLGEDSRGMSMAAATSQMTSVDNFQIEDDEDLD